MVSFQAHKHSRLQWLDRRYKKKTSRLFRIIFVSVYQVDVEYIHVTKSSKPSSLFLDAVSDQKLEDGKSQGVGLLLCVSLLSVFASE